MKTLYRLFRIPGYQVLDVKINIRAGKVDVYLDQESSAQHLCHRCGELLGAYRGKHPVRAQGLSVGLLNTYFHFFRHKGQCLKCCKARSEQVSFLSKETPHLTTQYSIWISTLCEISAVSRAAEFCSQDEMTVLRLDYARLKRLMQNYKIPEPKRISVDEVYARKKAKYRGESRNERFFTVISDLDTRRVIWVSESRSKKGLDQFYKLIGADACKQIKVAAMDQHEDYASSTREYCPNATIVWDRFHIAQNFEEAVNEARKDLHAEQARGSELQRLTRGKYRFLFVKKDQHRTPEERRHIDDVLKENKEFAKLELIKERMLGFFDAANVREAKHIFAEIGDWIWQAGFAPLMKWYNNLEKGWDTLKNYFIHRTSSSLSEGLNNVIKATKRRAYGYKNMEYFRLKIMQVCGYLNSKYVTEEYQGLTLF